ncbi:SMP-30/gluconolactonase/LRE family protein [Kiritimatiellaeota bacterium B1221]|nr:SMP-30/gluconolactonase/LRE family protein [Kiritimatiellaeota bacterium B1221]
MYKILCGICLFAQVVVAEVKVEKLVEGLQFTEGPVWVPERGGVIFSDIRAAKLYLWTEKTGLEIFREESGRGNGNVLDGEGRLITCEGAKRRVTRMEKEGSITVLADGFAGEPLNNPNDVTVGREGSVYFTDPDFGRRGREDFQFVYRVKPDGEVVKALPESFNKPNGIAMSRDGETLYVNVGMDHWTLAFPVNADGSVENRPQRVAEGIDKVLDGLAVHPLSGDLYLAVFTNNRNLPDEQGIQIFSAKGKYQGMIPIPGHTTNVCFGEDENTLYVTSGGSLFRVSLMAAE